MLGAKNEDACVCVESNLLFFRSHLEAAVHVSLALLVETYTARMHSYFWFKADSISNGLEYPQDQAEWLYKMQKFNIGN